MSFDNFIYGGYRVDKPTAPATKSRLEEVNKKIKYMLDAPSHQIEECFEESMAIARTLAAEVDARDEVIAEILALLKPKGEAMKYMLGDQKIDHEPAAHLYARACEIAGRVSDASAD